MRSDIAMAGTADQRIDANDARRFFDELREPTLLFKTDRGVKVENARIKKDDF
jgi:hypothetical protein